MRSGMEELGILAEEAGGLSKENIRTAVIEVLDTLYREKYNVY